MQGQWPFGEAASRPDDGAASITNEQADKDRRAVGVFLPEKVAAFAAAIVQSARLALSINTQCADAFPCRPPASAWGSIPVQQAQRAISTGFDAPDIERRPDLRQISLAIMSATALTHVLVNGFGWQGTAAPFAP